jgi:hypothetical protein
MPSHSPTPTLRSRSRSIALSVLALAILPACGGGGEAPVTPPATPPVAPPTAATPPPGMVMVTVSAASTPPGATVTGGGALLGTTPFVTPVPVPAPTPGVTQTFEFTFQLPGYTATTITASPVNNTINLNAVLAPMVAAVPPLGVSPPGTVPPGGAPPGVIIPGGTTPPRGTRFNVEGRGGGRIFDNHTTTAAADVGGNCRIDTLRVDISGNHSFHSDLIVRLRSPSGETYTLQNHARRNPFRTHTVSRARGAMSSGRWILEVEDNVGADGGNLSGFSLDITCS